MVLALKSQPKLATFGESLKGASLKSSPSSSRVALKAATRAATTKLAPAPKKTIAPAKPAAGTAKKSTGTVKLAAKPAPKPAPKPAAAASTVKKAPTGTVKLAAKPAAGTAKKAVGTQPVGTSPSKKITTIEVFTQQKTFRPKVAVAKPAPKILARVEQLRLLSKLEQAGLLSLLEKNGFTLSAIEKSGALSTAEKLGLISAAADRNTPGALYTLATALLLAGPALVYFTPDDSTALIAVQAVGALLCVLGGSAAYGGASLLASLQK